MDAFRYSQPLRRALWLGGSPCSGKTTIAHYLAARYGLALYTCDDHLWQHAAQADALQQPNLARMPSFSWDALFMRPVGEMLCDEIAIYRQEFPMIAADLLTTWPDAPIIVEGAALLPECVAPLIDPERAVWVVPSEAFLRRTYPQRGAWVQEILSQCSAPSEALARWMARDTAFARWTAEQAQKRGLRVIVVDGSHTASEVGAQIEAYWQPFLPASRGL